VVEKRCWVKTAYARGVPMGASPGATRIRQSAEVADLGSEGPQQRQPRRGPGDSKSGNATDNSTKKFSMSLGPGRARSIPGQASCRLSATPSISKAAHTRTTSAATELRRCGRTAVSTAPISRLHLPPPTKCSEIPTPRCLRSWRFAPPPLPSECASHEQQRGWSSPNLVYTPSTNGGGGSQGLQGARY